MDEGEDGCIQDALFCEGECQCWLHRWCAGVTRERYAVLSSTEDSFLCPSCTVARQQAAIASQQEDITHLRECVASLTDELRGLKANVATMQSRSLPLKGQANASNALPWSTVVKKGSNNRNGRRRNNSKSCERQSEGRDRSVENDQTAPQKSPQRNSGSHLKPNASKSMAGKERVQGVCRLWGIFKTTSVQAVKSALTKLTSVGNTVSIKRKYKTLG